jgi:thiamine-monophosphate kinase
MTDGNAPWNDEFGLIKKLIASAPDGNVNRDYLKEPPGDDAALICPLTRPVITTDTQKEGVHFSLDWQTPEEIGIKAVEITLSDLAASYATPIGLFTNLSLPAHIQESMVMSLYSGIYRALSKHNCVLGGGNISRASQLSIDLFAIGQGHGELFPKRANARIHDGLYCTGPLGLARAGLDALIREDNTFKGLTNKFKFPKARFDAAAILMKYRVTCVTDISDGLAGDAEHIADASNITISIDMNSRVLDSELMSYCETYHLSPMEMALSGGEEYELLFACPPETFNRIRADLPGVFQVGECLPFNGNAILNIPPVVRSFQHGKRQYSGER